MDRVGPPFIVDSGISEIGTNMSVPLQVSNFQGPIGLILILIEECLANLPDPFTIGGQIDDITLQEVV